MSLLWMHQAKRGVVVTKWIQKKIKHSSLILMSVLFPIGIHAQPLPQTMTLEECLSAAAKSNLTLLRQFSAEERAASDVTLARLMLDPAFNAVFRANARSSDDVLVASSDENIFLREAARVGVTMSYPLYDTGRRRDLLKAARLGFQQEEELTRQTLRDTRLQTVGAYFALLRTQQRVANDVLALAAARENLRGAEERLRLGAVTRADTLLAQSALSGVQAVQEENQAAMAVVQARLATVIGADAARIAPIAVEPMPVVLPVGNVDTLVEQATRESPEYARLLLAREAQRARISALRAERSPAIDLRAGIGYILQGSSTSANYFLLSAQISLPLLDTPRLQARERNLQSQVQDQELAIQQEQQGLREVIVTAFAQYRGRTARLGAAQDALAAVEEASRFAQERYQVGRGTQGETLDALTRLASARQSVSDARTDLNLTLSTLRLLTQKEAQRKEKH